MTLGNMGNLSPLQKKRLMGLSRMSDEQEYDSFWNRAIVELKFSLWPRKSYENKKWIFGPAYRACVTWTGQGDPIHEYRWLTTDEYLFGLLKGKYVKRHY
jgi:hypothetical protein